MKRIITEAHCNQFNGGYMGDTGWRIRNGNFHPAKDLSCKDGHVKNYGYGTAFFSPWGCTVLSTDKPVYGKSCCLIFHKEGITPPANGIIMFVSHLSNLLVSNGKYVPAGTPVGTMGTSGCENCTPHFHTELWSRSGYVLDLAYYIEVVNKGKQPSLQHNGANLMFTAYGKKAYQLKSDTPYVPLITGGEIATPEWVVEDSKKPFWANRYYRHIPNLFKTFNL